jgi:hypothetical protein
MSFTLRIILSLLIVKSRSLTIFSAARQSFNTGLSRFGSTNDFSPTALAASECISSDAVDESKSVHLQLNAKLSEIEVEVEEEEEDDEKGDTEDNANTIVSYEYFRPNDSTILLAALGSRLESTALKYFANETFGRDSSALEGAVLMKVSRGPCSSVICLIFNRKCYALIDGICSIPNLHHTSTPFAIHHADE